MKTPTELILVTVIVTNLVVLGQNRIGSCISAMAVQGVALGLLPLFAAEHNLDLQLITIVFVTLALKGILFPKLLNRSLHVADVRDEVEPFVGFATSILMGIVFLAASYWVTSQIDPPVPIASKLVLPTALATILIGLLLIAGRRKALMQVIGYLVLENGIFVFGVGVAHEELVLVELGILLDVFVAVFVMGIAIFHISREFDHIDVDQLSQLKD